MPSKKACGCALGLSLLLFSQNSFSDFSVLPEKEYKISKGDRYSEEKKSFNDLLGKRNQCEKNLRRIFKEKLEELNKEEDDSKNVQKEFEKAVKNGAYKMGYSEGMLEKCCDKLERELGDPTLALLDKDCVALLKQHGLMDPLLEASDSPLFYRQKRDMNWVNEKVKVWRQGVELFMEKKFEKNKELKRLRKQDAVIDRKTVNLKKNFAKKAYHEKKRKLKDLENCVKVIFCRREGFNFDDPNWNHCKELMYDNKEVDLLVREIKKLSDEMKKTKKDIRI